MKISVSSSDELIRVDLFLSQRLKEFSRTNIQKMIDNKLVKINGESIKKNSILNYGDVIEINFEENKNNSELSLEKWEYPIDVIYKDEDFAIINKPRGIISHPAKGNYNKTIVNIILNTFQNEIKGSVDPLRPGIVHRLDKDTTGVMIIPFNEYAHWKIAEQFQERTIKKEYIAITWGSFDKESGMLENFVIRNSKVFAKNRKNSSNQSTL